MPGIEDEGRRFSHVYLARGTPTSDSPRMRKRMAVLVSEIPYEYDLTTKLEMELGVSIAGWTSFYLRCEIRDLLDFATVIYHQLDKRGGEPRRRNSPEAWIAVVNRIFREENVSYVMGSNGGVHYAHDAEFAHNASSAIAAIQGKRYENIRAEFAQVQAALDETPPNGKDAIRKTFTSLEGLFRLMFPTAARLGSAEAKAHVSPVLTRVCSAQITDLRASEKMLAAFSVWIDAAHFYRHEHGREEVAQPQIGLAISMVSIGAAHLRWLAELDAKIGSP